jgi:hypothetical protein
VSGWEWVWRPVVAGLVLAAIIAAVRWLWSHRAARPGLLLGPRLAAGPSQFRFAEQSNKASVRIVNRGRRATFQASVDEVRYFRLSGGGEVRAHLAPPWPVPWCPGDGWEDGPGVVGGLRDLLRKQSWLLCIGWFEMAGTQLNTFSFYGVDHYQPFPVNTVEEVAITVRVFNRDADRSWAWNVTYVFPPEAIDPVVRIKRWRWWS